MTNADFKFTLKYMHSYGNKVRLAIKNRIRKDKLIDTGALLNSIDYHIKVTKNEFQVLFTIGDGIFKYGSGLPSEYGVYQDQGTVYIQPHYFFSAPVQGLTKTIFKERVAKEAAKDIANFYRKEFKNSLKK
jgi:hypothetical protein